MRLLQVKVPCEGKHSCPSETIYWSQGQPSRFHVYTALLFCGCHVVGVATRFRSSFPTALWVELSYSSLYFLCLKEPSALKRQNVWSQGFCIQNSDRSLSKTFIKNGLNEWIRQANQGRLLMKWLGHFWRAHLPGYRDMKAWLSTSVTRGQHWTRPHWDHVLVSNLGLWIWGSVQCHLSPSKFSSTF